MQSATQARVLQAQRHTHTRCTLSYSAIAGRSIDKEKGALISGLITVIEHSCCYKERTEAGHSTSEAFND